MIEPIFLTKPGDYAESMLVKAILDGAFPPGTQLPGERILATQLGVTRPTLREAIQRLARDGWLTVAHGKPTLVNNYWEEGGLNVLSKLVEYQSDLPPDFVSQLLEVRFHLAPAYTRAAVEADGPKLAEFLDQGAHIDDSPAAFARFDWRLHRFLTIHCRNPIYTLILNGFRGFYEDIGCLYFDSISARQNSAVFYQALASAAAGRDGDRAEALCREVMRLSIHIWNHRQTADSKEVD